MWAIFFVILLVVVFLIGYMYRKQRAILAIETSDLQKLEERVIQRRAELAEHQLLLDKRDGGALKKVDIAGKALL